MVKAMEAMPTETFEIPAEEPPVEDTTAEAAMPPEVPSETGTSAVSTGRNAHHARARPNRRNQVGHDEVRAAVSHRWQADSPVNVDVHGDPADAPKDFYHGYGKGKNITKSSGTIVAAFDGKHGWFWRNRSEKNSHARFEHSRQLPRIETYFVTTRKTGALYGKDKLSGESPGDRKSLGVAFQCDSEQPIPDEAPCPPRAFHTGKTQPYAFIS